MNRAILLFLLLAISHDAYGASVGKSGNGAVPAFTISGSRVRAKDVLGIDVTDVDLGRSPPIGVTRVIERAEVERAYANAHETPPKRIPETIRVVRKTRRLTAHDVEAAIRSALADTKLPRGAMFTNVHAIAIEVPDEFHHVMVDLPPLPRRAGPITAQATVTFVSEGDTPLAKVTMPVDLALPPEAAFAEIARGAPLTLIVRRGLVEVTISATAATDADIGAVFPLTIRPSGRVVRARAVDKDHAVLLEDS